MLAYVGLRPEELAGLQRKHLPARRHRITVERTIVAGVVGPTKTRTRRIVAVPEPVRADLVRLEAGSADRAHLHRARRTAVEPRPLAPQGVDARQGHAPGSTRPASTISATRQRRRRSTTARRYTSSTNRWGTPPSSPPSLATRTRSPKLASTGVGRRSQTRSREPARKPSSEQPHHHASTGSPTPSTSRSAAHDEPELRTALRRQHDHHAHRRAPSRSIRRRATLRGACHAPPPAPHLRRPAPLGVTARYIESGTCQHPSHIGPPGAGAEYRDTFLTDYLFEAIPLVPHNGVPW